MHSFIKKFVIIILFCSNSFYAQTNANDLSASIEFTPYFEKALIKIHSDADSILNISIQIRDQQKKIVKTQKLPNEFRYIKSYIDLLDLLPGKYIILILKDSIQLNSTEFTKDEILTEPQKLPVIRKD